MTCRDEGEQAGGYAETRARGAAELAETEAYLLACGRYVELNPVRARMVKRPEQYRWSSYRARAGLTEWGWLDRDPFLNRGNGAPPSSTFHMDAY